METIKNAVPQGSIQGIRLFLLYINDLPLRINISSKALLYADDTSVSISDTTIHEVQTKSIIALDNINKWFMHNGLSLNLREKKPNKLLRTCWSYATHVLLQSSYTSHSSYIQTRFGGGLHHHLVRHHHRPKNTAITLSCTHIFSIPIQHRTVYAPISKSCVNKKREQSMTIAPPHHLLF